METMCNAWIFNHNAVSERKWVDLKHGIIKVQSSMVKQLIEVMNEQCCTHDIQKILEFSIRKKICPFYRM